MQDRIHRDMNIGLHQRNNHEELKKDIRKYQLIEKRQNDFHVM